MQKQRDHHKHQQRGRRHNRKGRSSGGERYVKLPHWLLKSPAWQSLKPQPRALYIELSQRYNSYNNGEISMSVREAASLLHIAKDTATSSFWELEEKGFIRRNQCGSFNYKLRHATTWILTQHPLGDEPPKKDFMNWRPPKTKPGPKSGENCPKRGTDDDDLAHVSRIIVLVLGPWSQSCTVSRSQFAGHI